MGSTNSVTTQSQFNKHWKRSDAIDNLTIWQNKHNPSSQLEQYYIHNYEEHRNAQLQSLRKISPHVVNAFLIDNDRFACCQDQEGTNLYIERIPLRLSNIEDIPYPDTIHLFNACIAGFQSLASVVGYFRVDEDQVGINLKAQVKVWLNVQFESNQILGSKNVTQSQMIQDILEIIFHNSDHQSYPPNIPDLLYYIGPANQETTFKQIRDKFHTYTKQFTESYIPIGLQCVHSAGGTRQINSWCRNNSSFGFQQNSTRLQNNLFHSKLIQGQLNQSQNHQIQNVQNKVQNIPQPQVNNFVEQRLNVEEQNRFEKVGSNQIQPQLQLQPQPTIYQPQPIIYQPQIQQITRPILVNYPQPQPQLQLQPQVHPHTHSHPHPHPHSHPHPQPQFRPQPQQFVQRVQVRPRNQPQQQLRQQSQVIFIRPQRQGQLQNLQQQQQQQVQEQKRRQIQQQQRKIQQEQQLRIAQQPKNQQVNNGISFGSLQKQSSKKQIIEVFPQAESRLQQQRVISQTIQVKENLNQPKGFVNEQVYKNPSLGLVQNWRNQAQKQVIQKVDQNKLNSYGRAIPHSINVNQQRYNTTNINEDGKSSPDFLALLKQLKNNTNSQDTEVYSLTQYTPASKAKDISPKATYDPFSYANSQYLNDTQNEYRNVKESVDVLGSKLQSLPEQKYSGQYNLSKYQRTIDPELEADIIRYK